jgi:hypothetical protein
MNAETIAIYSLAGVLILMLLACIIRYYCNCARIRGYQNFSKSALAANKLWIGENPTERVEEVIPEITPEQQAKIDALKAEKALVWHRDIANYCRSAAHEIEISQEVPFCGTRLSKSYAVMRDALVDSHYKGRYQVMLKLIEIPEDTRSSLPSGSAKLALGEKESLAPLVNWNNAKLTKALAAAIQNVSHPYVMNTIRFDISAVNHACFSLQWYSTEGSLRDLLYQPSDLLADASKKYPAQAQHFKTRAKPLRKEQIQKFGRQILEALLYFESIGLPYYHLHSGNILIVNGSCRVTDYENVFFGLQNRLHDKLRRLPVHPFVGAFGCVLHEMVTGREIHFPDKKGEVDVAVPATHAEFKSLLDVIFFDKTLDLRALQCHPLFSRVDIEVPDASHHFADGSKRIARLISSVDAHYSMLFKLAKRKLVPVVPGPASAQKEESVVLLIENDDVDDSLAEAYQAVDKPKEKSKSRRGSRDLRKEVKTVSDEPVFFDNNAKPAPPSSRVPSQPPQAISQPKYATHKEDKDFFDSDEDIF